MANKRNPKKGDTGRDAGGFVALPWSVLDCQAYQTLSHPAKALLFEFARQSLKDNNGRLLASRAYLSKRGWGSADVIQRAKTELITAGFVHETVKGHRPNKAGWYAVTWRTLDRIPGYDSGAAETFERGAYRKNTPLIPSGGTGGASIAPSGGTERVRPVPSPGTIRPTFAPSPVPSPGHHLDKPSTGSCEPAHTHHTARTPNATKAPPMEEPEPPAEAITTLVELWARVGLRSLWKTLPPPAVPHTRMAVAKAAQQAALAKPCRQRQRVSAGPVVHVDGDGIVRERGGEGCHDTAAWMD